MNDEEAPTIRLAHAAGAQGENVLRGLRGTAQLPPDRRPSLLVSYFYLNSFWPHRHRYAYRDWVLDSGAFSAYSIGAKIDLQEYIDACKRLLDEDPTLVEIYALDVIGDAEASYENAKIMWKQGVAAIPCFHAGEPWDALKRLADEFPKVALGGVALARAKRKDVWAEQAFARVWPKRIHGFGYGSPRSILGLPWHSVDATNWEVAPCKYGQWQSFGGARMSWRGSRQNIRSEVEFYLRLEERARRRWRKQMEELAATPESPAVRLAMGMQPEHPAGQALMREQPKDDS